MVEPQTIPQVLIVDDDVSELRAWVPKVPSGGFHFTTVNTVNEALIELSNKRFDVVFVDNVISPGALASKKGATSLNAGHKLIEWSLEHDADANTCYAIVGGGKGVGTIGYKEKQSKIDYVPRSELWLNGIEKVASSLINKEKA